MSEVNEIPEVIEFDLDAIGSAIANAPDAGFVNQNYGQLTALPQIVAWGKKDPATGKSPKVARPMRKGDSPKAGESIELLIRVNIAEFNPALNFSYERSVPIRKSTAKDKSNWSEIVEPSLVAVFGPDWLAKIVQRPYVCVEDVADCNGVTSKKSGKVLTVPKFIAVYESAMACKAARDARYSPSGEDAADANLQSVVTQVRSLLDAMAGDMDTVRSLLVNPPYNAYDPDQLLALALV